MAIVTGHGGACCGMRHSYGWSGFITTPEGFAAHLDTQIRVVHANRLIEIVLTDGQIRRRAWVGNTLAEKGFRLVTRFRNSNSGSICNVFHRIPRRAPIPDHLRATTEVPDANYFRIRYNGRLVGRTEGFDDRNTAYESARWGRGYDSFIIEERDMNGNVISSETVNF